MARHIFVIRDAFCRSRCPVPEMTEDRPLTNGEPSGQTSADSRSFLSKKVVLVAA